MNYRDQLNHPKWQRRRLEMLEAAGWKCEDCSAADEQLHVHHERYTNGLMAWEYEDDLLRVLCHTCHAARHGHAQPKRRWGIVSKGTANLLERALWLLLQRGELWSALDGESRDLFASQPPPYAIFFVRIERCWHEHGALASAALLSELREAAKDDVGISVLARLAAFHQPRDEDIARELALVIAKLRLQAVEDEIKLLLDSGAASPHAQARGRELMTARKMLKARGHLNA